MTTTLVVLLVGGTVATLGLLAWALVAATDRLRATVDQLLGVRSAVEPRLRRLQDEADRASAHVARIRATPLRVAGPDETDQEPGADHRRRTSGTHDHDPPR